MAKAASENFPVASRLLPSRLRAHLLAIYGFARLVDDAGDEHAGDRMLVLDAIERDLDRLYAGAEPRNELIARLAGTVRDCGIPQAPLRRLILANRQDQEVTRYRTIDELLAYCELSANPVGELVLHVFDAATPERIRLSDAVCTALQLVEHCQDASEDAARGRVYMPQADMERFGCAAAELATPPASPAVRRLVAFELERAGELLERGTPLISTLRGRPKLAVAAFVAGGQAAIDAIRKAGYDVIGGAPRPTRRGFVSRLIGALARSRRTPA
jgi:squalene synthase HpnC